MIPTGLVGRHIRSSNVNFPGNSVGLHTTSLDSQYRFLKLQHQIWGPVRRGELMPEDNCLRCGILFFSSIFELSPSLRIIEGSSVRSKILL
jgi:hypothetical protein